VTASELARDDNPRCLAVLVTAAPLVLASLLVIEWSRPDTPPLATGGHAVQNCTERLTEGLHNADGLVSDPENLAFTVSRLLTEGDVSLPVEIQRVIDILSR
jgi:hypothetical protein